MNLPNGLDGPAQRECEGITPLREAWQAFLKLLAPDEQAAAGAYGKLRERFVFYVERKAHQLNADDVVDEAIERTVRKTSEGVVIENIHGYLKRVTDLVVLERLRILKGQQEKEVAVDDDENGPPLPSSDPTPESALLDSDEELQVRKYRCMRKCFFEVLSREDRDFLARYTVADNKKLFAEENQKTTNSVSMRAHSLRKKLKECHKRRLAALTERGSDVFYKRRDEK